MKRISPYDRCPTYETPSFRLRLVRPEDAEELLACYSDPVAVARMNADNCTSDFFYRTPDDMRRCIDYWLSEYRSRRYVRFAVVAKESGAPVGTVEMFGGEAGVLRIDLATAWEPRAAELAKLAIDRWYLDFQAEKIVTKVGNAPERAEAFARLGFVPSDFRAEQGDSGYMERARRRWFKRERGVARCGLACCLCSENAHCAGCKRDGCKGADSCAIRRCVLERNLPGCWGCAEFPCGETMLSRPRQRAFLRFVALHGEDALMDALERDERAGVQYHYAGEIVGDYDRMGSEAAVLELLENGVED